MQAADDSFPAVLVRAQGGDRGALERLIAPELPRLLAFIRVRSGQALRRRESSTDILQSVCREVCEDLGTMKETTEDGFRRWLYAVALNRIRKKHRFHTAGKRDQQRDAECLFDTHVDEESLLASYQGIASPSRGAIAKEELARIEQALDELTDEQREVLSMARFMGLSQAEIAARTERSEAAVAQLIARAKVKLARLLT